VAETPDLRYPLGSDLYYSLVFAAPSERRASYALHALLAEIDAIPRTCSDRGVARVKLAWWREELARLLAGQARHPVTRSLAACVAETTIDFNRLQEFPDAVETVLDWNGPPGEAAFADYLTRAYGSLWRHWALLNSAPLNAASDNATVETAVELGRWCGEFLILQTLPAELAADIYKLPAEALAQFDLSADALHARGQDCALQALFEHRISRISAGLQDPLARLSAGHRSEQLPLIIFARIALQTLDEIHAGGSRVLNQHVALTPLRKLWIAWRTRWRI
jgi:phytoene synthase